MQTTLDGKAPTSHTHTIANITNLQTTLDGKQATLTSTNTIGVFNSAHFENVSSAIQIKSSFKPTTTVSADTAVKLASSVNIAGVAFDGSGSIHLDYFI